MPYSYAIDSLAYNPAFQSAWNTPNLNQMALAQSVPTTAGTTTDSTNVVNKPKEKEEKKEGISTSALVVGTALTVGAALLCRKAYKAGTGNGVWEKMSSGFKGWFGTAKNAKNKLFHPKQFSLTEQNNQILCTIPNRTNCLTGTAAISELGVSNAVPEISKTTDGVTKLAEGIKIRKGTITVGGNTFKVKNGKIFDSPIDLQKADKATRDKVHELLKKLNNGENEAGIKIEEFLHTDNGTTRVFENKGTGYDLRLTVSDKHNINSDVVKQFREKNSKVDGIIKEYVLNGNKDGLKIVSAEVPSTTGTFIIKNGEITGIKIGEDTYKKGSTKFDSLLYDHKKEFEEALKNKDKYQNAVYQVA